MSVSTGVASSTGSMSGDLAAAYNVMIKKDILTDPTPLRIATSKSVIAYGNTASMCIKS